MTKKPVEMIARAQYDLPAWLNREAGRIIIRWAHLEFRLQQIVWHLLLVTEEQGRVAVREPRVSDRIDMIVDLAKLRNLTIDFDRWTKIKTDAEPLNSKRDLLAHGIWALHPDQTWMVLNTEEIGRKTPLSISAVAKSTPRPYAFQWKLCSMSANASKPSSKLSS